MASFEENASILETLAPQIEATKTLAYDYAMPDCEGWEEIWQNKGITASKRSTEGNQICIRGQTNYPNSSPLSIFKVVQNVCQFDDAFKQHDFLARLSPTVVIDHVFIDVPWPVTPRDGLSATFIDVMEDGTVSQISFGIENDICPPIPKMIRSELTVTAYILKPDGQGGTNATFMLQMDPMGSIPDFLKKKMVNSKPMVLDSLRGILDKQQSTDADATTSPATLDEAIAIFDMKPVTSL